MLSVRLRVVALGLGGSARASHTPSPSREGRLGRRFLEEYDWIFRFVSGRRYSDKRITCMSYISAPL